mmetsp:Transcript_26883/g.62872  ORF Transcript_26883/g.62872 Transcript_26883/m.62872 type:complete len:205 (-) Transcript_26883:392-1006(-)
MFLARKINEDRALTLPDVFGKRYGKLVEVLASVCTIISFLFLLAGNLVGMGAILSYLLNMSLQGSIAVRLSIVGAAAAPLLDTNRHSPLSRCSPSRRPSISFRRSLCSSTLLLEVFSRSHTLVSVETRSFVSVRLILLFFCSMCLTLRNIHCFSSRCHAGGCRVSIRANTASLVKTSCVILSISHDIIISTSPIIDSDGLAALL